MNVLIVGGGGREHALAWKLGQSERVSRIYCAPGNAGTSTLGTNLPIKATELDALARAAREHQIDLTVAGPETPLAEGIVDLFQEKGLPIFGPSKTAAAIESSKVFSKRLMLKHGIPTAAAEIFASYEEAHKYIAFREPPMVVKADGLAAGKGVVVARTRQQALEALYDIMVKRAFGAAGDQVLIEECLTGREASLLAFTDGHTVVPMAPACDYKPVYDGDQGPNTGGMGGYSPPEFLDDGLVKEITHRVLIPAVTAMAMEGRPYKGVIYAGLMITAEGPRVIEFNCRFGDPEAQVILPRLKGDLLGVMLAVVNGGLDKLSVRWSDEAYVGTVMASGGYPGAYSTGFPISGLEDVDSDILVFHAGTRQEHDESSGRQRVVTDGGRVLEVVAGGSSLAEAREKVYRNISRIKFEGCHYRTDIAARAVQ